MRPEEWDDKGNMTGSHMLKILHFGKERESFPMCIGESHLMPDSTHSHWARVEYMAMLIVFNWRMTLNSGKVNWRKELVIKDHFYRKAFCCHCEKKLWTPLSQQFDTTRNTFTCMYVNEIVAPSCFPKPPAVAVCCCGWPTSHHATG